MEAERAEEEQAEQQLPESRRRGARGAEAAAEQLDQVADPQPNPADHRGGADRDRERVRSLERAEGAHHAEGDRADVERDLQRGAAAVAQTPAVGAEGRAEDRPQPEQQPPLV